MSVKNLRGELARLATCCDDVEFLLHVQRIYLEKANAAERLMQKTRNTFAEPIHKFNREQCVIIVNGLDGIIRSINRHLQE